QSPVFVISDYSKGVCQPGLVQDGLGWAAADKSLVLVDPAKDGDWARYCGPTTVFKINLVQAVRFLKRSGCEVPAAVLDINARVRRSYYDAVFGLVRVRLDAIGKYHALWLTLGQDGSMLAWPGWQA